MGTAARTKTLDFKDAESQPGSKQGGDEIWFLFEKITLGAVWRTDPGEQEQRQNGQSGGSCVIPTTGGVTHPDRRVTV